MQQKLFFLSVLLLCTLVTFGQYFEYLDQKKSFNSMAEEHVSNRLFDVDISYNQALPSNTIKSPSQVFTLKSANGYELLLDSTVSWGCDRNTGQCQITQKQVNYFLNYLIYRGGLCFVKP